MTEQQRRLVVLEAATLAVVIVAFIIIDLLYQQKINWLGLALFAVAWAAIRAAMSWRKFKRAGARAIY